MYVEREPISTGDPRKDRHIALLRHSGSAVWLVLGLILLHEAFRWAGSTELGHMVRAPIKKASDKALDGAFQTFKNHTWVIGPALLAGAALLKRRTTGHENLSSNGEAELDAVVSGVTVRTDKEDLPTIKINASELFALAKILKKEIGLPGSLSDELSTEKISQLLGDMGVQSDVRWQIIQDEALNVESQVSPNGRVYGEKLNELLVNSDLDGAIEFGCTMLTLQGHTGDVYDDRTDAGGYISYLEKKSALDRSDQPLAEAGVQISDSFLQNLKNVLSVTDDADLARAALLDEAALKDIAAGHIRTELKLRDALQESTGNKKRTRAR